MNASIVDGTLRGFDMDTQSWAIDKLKPQRYEILLMMIEQRQELKQKIQSIP